MIPEEDIDKATKELSKVLGMVEACHLVTRNQDLFNEAHKLCRLPYKSGYLYSGIYILTDALEYQKEHNSLKNIYDSVLKSANDLSDKILKTNGFTDKQIKDITNWHILPPLENKHKIKKMTSFDQYKESVGLNNYFAGKGYTVGQTKELCNWYLKTIDNSQQITKYED